MAVDFDADLYGDPGDAPDAVEDVSPHVQPEQSPARAVSSPGSLEGAAPRTSALGQEVLERIVFSPEAWLGYSRRVFHRQQDLRHEIEPDDLLAEAHLRAWRQRDTFHGETPAEARAWFARIVRRTAGELSRGLPLLDGSTGLQSIEELSDSETTARSAGQPMERDASKDGLEALVRAELRALVLRGIALLPDPEAYAILEVRLGAATVQDVAARLRTSARAVSALLWGGTRRLEKVLRGLRRRVPQPESGIDGPTMSGPSEDSP